MTAIPPGIDNPTGFKPETDQTAGKFKPTAFIKDQATWDYLVNLWKKYAIQQERNYNRPPSYFGDINYSKEDPRNHPTWKEKFDVDPKYYGYKEKFIGSWEFGTDDINETHGGIGEVDWRYTLVNKEIPGLFRESAVRMHSVNFFEEIQQNLTKRGTEENNQPLHILVTGSDVGFFNDELRANFGDAIDVAGTTVELSRSSIRKQRFYGLIKTGKLQRQISPEMQQYLVTSLKPAIDKRDAKWRSILQMENGNPEFDMIIDTAGELLYSYDDRKPEIFESTFQACIQKLNPGGKLYIAELLPEAQQFVLDQCHERGLGLEMHKYEDRNQGLKTNYIITKPI